MFLLKKSINSQCHILHRIYFTYAVLVAIICPCARSALWIGWLFAGQGALQSAAGHTALTSSAAVGTPFAVLLADRFRSHNSSPRSKPSMQGSLHSGSVAGRGGQLDETRRAPAAPCLSNRTSQSETMNVCGERSAWRVGKPVWHACVAGWPTSAV